MTTLLKALREWLHSNDEKLDFDLMCTIPTPPGSTIITKKDLRELVEPILTFISHYDYDAVYLNGFLIYYGPKVGYWNLLKTLGYECNRLSQIPDTVPKEYKSDERYRWIPPKCLNELLEIQQKIKEREKLEKIEYHKRELCNLENQ